MVAAVGLKGHIAATAGVLILGADSAAPVCVINWADSVTRFPLLNTVISTHVQTQLLCTEVRTGNGGDAVKIAEAILIVDDDTRAVHLGSTHFFIFKGIT